MSSIADLERQKAELGAKTYTGQGCLVAIGIYVLFMVAVASILDFEPRRVGPTKVLTTTSAFESDDWPYLPGRSYLVTEDTRERFGRPRPQMTNRLTSKWSRRA